MELEKSLNWMYNKYLEDNSIRVSGVETAAARSVVRRGSG